METRPQRGRKSDPIREPIQIIETTNAVGNISVIATPMITTQSTASSQRRLTPSISQVNLGPGMKTSAPTIATVVIMKNQILPDNVMSNEGKKKDNNIFGKIVQSAMKGDQDELVDKPKRQSASAKARKKKGSVRVREFDYDTHPTKLIKMVEKKKWEEVIQRCADNSREVSSWICKFQEVDGVDNKKKKEVRWRILPLHSAIAHQAPFKVIKALVAAYPASVKKGDDKQMLPLHIAFSSGVSLEAAAFLFDANPDAVNIKNNKNHTPLHVLKAYRTKYEKEKNKGKVSSEITDKNRKDLIKYYLENRKNRKRTGRKKKKDNETVHSKTKKDDETVHSKKKKDDETAHSQKKKDNVTVEAKVPLDKQAPQIQKSEDKVKGGAKSQSHNDDEMVLQSYDSDSSFYDSFDNESEDEYPNILINYGRAALDGFLSLNLNEKTSAFKDDILSWSKLGVT